MTNRTLFVGLPNESHSLIQRIYALGGDYGKELLIQANDEITFIDK
jgi:hypothetical protein